MSGLSEVSVGALDGSWTVDEREVCGRNVPVGACVWLCVWAVGVW